MSAPLLSVALLATAFATSPHAHKAAPSGPLDVVLSALGVVIVVLVIIYAIKFFVRPKEQSHEHIKHRVLQDEVEL